MKFMNRVIIMAHITSKIIKYFKFLANGKVYKNQGVYYTK